MNQFIFINVNNTASILVYILSIENTVGKRSIGFENLKRLASVKVIYEVLISAF